MKFRIKLFNNQSPLKLNFMTITIFGATGQVGEQLVKQGLARGYNVKAFGRNVEKFIDMDLYKKNFTATKGYVFDEKDVFKAVTGSDAVFSVLGGAIDGSDNTRSLGNKNIIEQMEKAGVKRIIAVGGMGVLNADNSDELVMDAEDFPEMYLPVSREHNKVLNLLEASSLDWTLVCPPNINDDDGNISYTVKANQLPEPNTNKIDAGDLADFILNEASKNEYVKQKVGIASL